MFITKKSAGSVDGYKFAAGQRVDVPDELGAQLLALAPGEFTLCADKPKGRKAAAAETEPEQADAAAAAMPQD